MSSGSDRTWYARLRQRWVDRAAKRMYDRLAKDRAAYRSSPSSLAASALAAVVLAASAAFVVVLVAASIHARGVAWVPVVIGWSVVIALRPRIPRLPRDVVVLDAAAHPGLYAVVGRLAHALGVRPPRVIAVDTDFNAYVTSLGVPPRPAMVLGLPYFTLLSWPARLAVVAHELGHLRGRDTTRGRVLGAASRTLAGVHYLISPSDDDLVMGARDPVVEASIGFGTVLARGVQTMLALPFLLLWLALERLSVLDSQHREYLADRRAAAVVGTEALVEVLLHDLEGVRTAAGAAARRGEDPFAHLAGRRPRTAAERAARMRELEAKVHRADATHPPDHLRIRLLEADPQPPSAAMPAEAELKLAEEELVRLRAASAKRLSQDLRFGRYR